MGVVALSWTTLERSGIAASTGSLAPTVPRAGIPVSSETPALSPDLGSLPPPPPQPERPIANKSDTRVDGGAAAGAAADDDGGNAR